MGFGRQVRRWDALSVTVLLVVAMMSVETCEAAALLDVKDTGHLTLATGARTDGPLQETGKATGTLSGDIHASISLNAATAKASFTLYTRGGTISGSGSGALKYGKGGYDSFGGSARITGGTGRYAGARGTGRIYGSIDRINYHASVQVDGTLHY